MKSLDSALETHLQTKRWALCSAMILDLTDGTTIGLTDHQTAITVDAVECSPVRAYTGQAIASKADLSVGNSDVDVILDSSAINESDVLGGRYNFARYRTYICKYTEPVAYQQIDSGWLGNAQVGGPVARIETRDLAQALQGQLGERMSPTCRASLGDLRCGVSLATHTVAGTITSINEDKVSFTDSTRAESVNFFSYGKLTWTTGAANAGLSMEVKSSTSGGVLTLAMPMPKSFATGDGYSVYRGCNRMPTTCKGVFNNINRIRAEVFLVGEDEIAKFGRQ